MALRQRRKAWAPGQAETGVEIDGTGGVSMQHASSPEPEWQVGIRVES